MFHVACRLVMFRINERKVYLGQKGVIKRYLSQLLGSSVKDLRLLYKSSLHFIVFFLFSNAQHVLCRAVGSKFLKYFVDGYYALGSVS